MTAKEYRDKESITDANFWNGDEIDFDAICEFADDYHKSELKLLGIANVSNRRELLLAFGRHLNVEYKFVDIDDIDVDEFIESQL